MAKKILIIAGEPSADLYASHLVKAVRKDNPDVFFFGTGGDAMAAAGVQLLYHVRQLSILGFAEVVRHLAFMRRVKRTVCAAVAREQPALVILIDYPGFNLRLARYLKKHHPIPILYYISPQVWAWGKGRVRQMARLIDRLVVILPFEKEFFRPFGIKAQYVGHPLIETAKARLERNAFYQHFYLDPSLPLVGLLPGSRQQEVDKILPVMLAACSLIRRQKKVQAAVAVSTNVDPGLFASLVARSDQPAALCPGLSYDVIQHADLVLTASGSATLETAYLKTPMIILYKVSWLTWWLGRMMVKLPYIGLVNIVAGRLIVPEFLQADMQPDKIASSALQLLTDKAQYRAMVDELALVGRQLGSGSPSGQAAAVVAEMLG